MPVAVGFPIWKWEDVIFRACAFGCSWSVTYGCASADLSEAVGFRLLVQISLSPRSDGQSGRLVQSSEVLSLLPLSAAGCGGYLGW